jgi:streptogramin lyase
MKVAGMFVRRSAALFASVQLSLGAVALAGLFASAPSAYAQAPYLLPYTIQVLAGGGSSPTVTPGNTSPCLGSGTNLVEFDSYGDGCLVTSSSVVAGAAGSDLHDVVVDQEGNVYFLDNGSNGVVRRIDAHSGLITVFAGSYQSQSGFCTATQDKYGDGCPSADARSNGGSLNSSGTDVPSPTTSALGKARGLGIDKAGNIYIADYGANITH